MSSTSVVLRGVKHSLSNESSPVEIRLTKRNLKVVCIVVHEDENTETLEVDSISMRGAQREMTGHLLKLGYRPASRWESDDDSAGAETYRVFRLDE